MINIPEVEWVWKGNQKVKKMIEVFKSIIRIVIPDYLLEQSRYFRVSRCLKRKKQWKRKRQRAYIFQIPSFGNGLLCVYRRGLSEIRKFKKKGCVVAIDYEDIMDIKVEELGNKNLWDLIFEQPCGISVAEALKMDTVILVNNFTYFRDYLKLGKEYDRFYYKKMNKLYGEIFPVKKNLKSVWDIEFSEMLLKRRVLGVSLREAFRLMHDNNTGWSERHPNEPNTNEVIQIIEKKMKEYNCEYVFLATEYLDSLEALSTVFGDKLLYTNRRRKYITQDYVKDIIRAQESDCSTEELSRISKRDGDGRREEKNREYVEEVYGLSKCTCLLGTPSNGMLTALLWNAGEYENVSYFGEKSFEGTSYF